MRSESEKRSKKKKKKELGGVKMLGCAGRGSTPFSGSEKEAVKFQGKLLSVTGREEGFRN